MPSEFLTDDQEQAYGHYLGPPSTQQLSRYFHLDDADRERVNERRGADNKLGFAVQLTTVRFLGTFLAEPTDVPSGLVAYVAAQLSIRDVACLADYAARPTTAWEHAAEIRRIYGYRDFTDPAEGFHLVRWLYTRAWLSSEQPSVLFDLATARLVERQVLLPGVSILARLVARIRERANARLYRKLARMPSAKQRDRLRELLVVPAGARRSALDRLRRGPTQPTAVGLLEALRRLNDVGALGVSVLDLSGIPAGRLRVLARYASSARAQVFQRMPADDPANLAPQPKDVAKQKDIVEVYLMGQVAAGKMPVDQAQRTAAYDWQNQYQQIPPAERQRIQHSRDDGGSTGCPRRRALIARPLSSSPATAPSAR